MFAPGPMVLLSIRKIIFSPHLYRISFADFVHLIDVGIKIEFLKFLFYDRCHIVWRTELYLFPFLFIQNKYRPFPTIDYCK